MQEGSELAWIEKKLECCLCHQTAKIPKVFACCGWVACDDCIQRYFQEFAACPVCGEVVEGQKYIHLPFVDSMLEVLPMMKRCVTANIVCSKHSKPHLFFCENCQQYLCSDCIYDLVCGGDKQHEGHTIKRATEMVPKIKDDLKRKLLELDQAQERIADCSSAIVEFASNLGSMKDDVLLKMYDKFKVMQDSYQKALGEATRRTAHKKTKIEKQSITLERLENDCFAALEKKSVGALLKASEFLDEVKEIDQMISQTDVTDPTHLPDNDLVPPFKQAKVRFNNFKSLKTNQILFGDPIEIHGNVWMLKMYPFGQSERMGRYSSVFLEFVRGDSRPCRLYYAVSIECVSGKRPNIYQECVVNASVEQSWGWKRFCPIEDLLSGHYTAPDGSLTLTVGIHPESYYVLWRWLKLDNSKKREEIRALRAKMQRLKR